MRVTKINKDNYNLTGVTKNELQLLRTLVGSIRGGGEVRTVASNIFARLAKHSLGGGFFVDNIQLRVNAQFPKRAKTITIEGKDIEISEESFDQLKKQLLD